MKKQITKIKNIMKKSLFLLIALLTVATFAFASCDKDDNHTPNATITNAFKAKYPNAGKTEWEMKKNYHVAEFRQNGMEVEAWFDSNGEWLMTETDIKFTNLPEAIQNSYNAGEYKNGWRVEDVDKIEKTGMATVFIIEVEKGEQEMDLYYAEDGTLIKAVADNGGNSQNLPEQISNVISKAIMAKYPNATILDMDQEKGMTEVDIMDGKTHKEVLFNAQNVWVSTSWEIRKSDVPANVMDAFKASEHKNLRIDDIDFYETPAGNYYRFELDKEAQDIYLMINPEGQIIVK